MFFILFLHAVFPAQGQTVRFPLRYSDNRRYFVDQAGTPFLYNAETGWQITYKLTIEEARDYFIFRKAQGFNTFPDSNCHGG